MIVEPMKTNPKISATKLSEKVRISVWKIEENISKLKKFNLVFKLVDLGFGCLITDYGKTKN
jgi:predicted HTH transcriptional regulator